MAGRDQPPIRASLRKLFTSLNLRGNDNPEITFTSTLNTKKCALREYPVSRATTIAFLLPHYLLLYFLSMARIYVGGHDVPLVVEMGWEDVA